MISTTISVKKETLRSHMKSLASHVDKPLFEKENSLLLEQLSTHPAWKEAKTTLLYAPLQEEPNLLPLLKEENRVHHRFLFPRIDQDNLLLYEWQPHALWKTGPFGLREPDPQTWPLIQLHEVDLAIIPGLAFDKKGGRLGHGRGFFDRLLSQPKCRATKLGIAWSWQMLEEIPQEHFDVRMDIVVTPLSIY